MYKLNHDCWVWSPGPPASLTSQHSRSLPSTVPSHPEGDEEDDVPVVCHCASGCDDIMSHAADARWSTCEPPGHSGIPNRSNIPFHDPVVTVMEADQGEMSPHFVGGYCVETPKVDTQGCVCAYGQRDAEEWGHCLPEPPYIYFGARRNIVVGVEVVEEVAVEEVITEDLFEDDLMDLETLQDRQVSPT